uniref:Uncharacterized protein n=1 Tax=Anguilla anguilla TaxID=7936 RepID=A0A0E9QWF1_ANGAN
MRSLVVCLILLLEANTVQTLLSVHPHC